MVIPATKKKPAGLNIQIVQGKGPLTLPLLFLFPSLLLPSSSSSGAPNKNVEKNGGRIMFTPGRY
jgi:hypothetical protein